MSSHYPSSFHDLDNEVATRPNLDPKDDDLQGDDPVQDWLTIRRRCELCKQRKVWSSNNSASVDRSLHKDELFYKQLVSTRSLPMIGLSCLKV